MLDHNKDSNDHEASDSFDAFSVPEGLEEISEPSQLIVPLDNELRKQIAQLMGKNIEEHSGKLPEGSVVQASRSTVLQHRGPLPPPSLLGGYGNVDASFPDRIVRMAERELAHNQEMDRETMALNERERRRYYDVISAKNENQHRYNMAGLIVGACIAIVALIGVFILLALDKPGLVWIPLSLVTPFLAGGSYYAWKAQGQKNKEHLDD